ncbi:MAG TPA: alpha/beta fold hydrolase [Burkholderiaceae bacterium]|nr:alpha/beta fold hydrolase [Burkholderiaceae bacterium]
MTNRTFQRDDVAFPSQGITCRAWLYRPTQSADSSSPCIVMAHGLGGTRDCGLEPFAERFVQAGIAVLLFDYRHFGASDGQPRQLLSIRKELQDWKAAVAFARTLPGVDAKRIGLWGTSLSGGHVITTAANDPSIAAISAQQPMVDGFAATLQMVRYAGAFQLARLAAYGLADQLRAFVGLSPVTLPIVGQPGEFATLSSHDSASGYGAVAGPGWKNEMTARMALTLMSYRPISKALNLKCPTLIQACMKDTVAPAPAAVKLARKAGPNVILKQYDMGHFDIYVGRNRETALADQLAFFQKALA